MKNKVGLLAATPTRLLAAAIAILPLAGCGQGDESVSATQHTVDQPTRGPQSWMWTTASDSDYHNIMGPLLGQSESDFIPQTHALTKRTQMWVDRIDATLRAAHPEALANVPKPVARVMKDGSTNAFVAPMPICYKVSVKVAAGTPNSGNTADYVFLDSATGELSEWPADLKCKTGSDPTGNLKSFADRFNGLSSDCKLTVGNDGKLTPSSACKVASDLSGIVAAKGVVLFQTANAITVFTGLFPAMSEEEFVGVIAHELGHYYRSHSTNHASEFDFFYTMGRHNAGERPTAEADLKDLGDNAVASSTLLSSSETYRSFASQKLRSELFFAVGSTIKKACAAGGCPATCKTAADYIKTSDFTDAIGKFPFAQGDSSAYSSFESKALACLDKLKLDTSAGTLNATAVSWDRFIGQIEKPEWPTWLALLPASTQRALGRMGKLAALRAGDAPSSGTLGAAVRAASKSFNDQDDEAEGLLKQAYDKHVGQYTVEQEADDEAAEWLADIGFDPKAMVKAMANLGAGDATTLRGMELGEQDCKTLWQNGWTGTDGNYKFVPVGDYSEVHHSTCFRMFNLEREIEAHHHQAAQTDLPQHGGAAWSQLQTQAAGMAESTGGGGNFFQVNHLLKKNPLLNCTYAASKFL